MGILLGQTEYKKFKKGISLTPKQAILSQCYECNGKEQSNEDCQGYSCSLYPYSPHGDENKYPYFPRKPKGRVGGNPRLKRRD